MKTLQTDVLVIGLGPSGSVAAGILQKAGIKTIVVEKESFPRFVIGESLLPRCMAAFDEAGFIDDLSKQNFQVKNGALFLHDNMTCDFSFETQFSEGWNWTWQMPRSDFDSVLAQNLINRGVEIYFQTEVINITFEGSNSTTLVKNNRGEEMEIAAKFIIDASGYGRVIPRLFDLDKPSNLPPKQTLLVHATDSKRSNYQQSNRIHAIAQSASTWIWVISFSTGNTSIGFVGNPDYFSHLGGTPDEQLRTLIDNEPLLAERFKEESFLFEPRTLKGWSVTTEQFFGDGFVLTGNVTEFLDPIFSSGVTLAAVSSSLAANLAIRQLGGETIDWGNSYSEVIQSGVDVFRTYVMAWYNGDLHKVFFFDQIDEKIKSQICSVLAGYVWDYTNPFVRNHQKNLKNLVEIIDQFPVKN